MKHILMLLLPLFLLLVTGCESDSPFHPNNPPNGNEDAVLNIRNNTADYAVVRINNGQEFVINSYSYRTFTFAFSNNISKSTSITVVVHYEGPLLTTGTRTITIESGETYNFDLNVTIATLNITNHTSALAWVTVNGGETHYLESYENQEFEFHMLANVTGTITIRYDGYHMFKGTENMTVHVGEHYSFTLEPNAGAISIANESNLTDIVAVNMALQSSTSWGSNVLSGILDPHETIVWAVDPDTWKVLIRDNNARYYMYSNYGVFLDETVALTFDDYTPPVLPTLKTGPGIASRRCELKKPGVF